MWLRYDVDAANTLVAIEDVPSGKTSLKCPYCGSGLTAKKGRIKEHHFAHTGETCRFVAGRNSREIPVLPLYDNFNIQLSGEELEQLKTLWREYGARGNKVPRFLVPRRFVWLGLLQDAESDCSDYEFTQLGQVPFGALPLTLFNQVQEPLLLKKLSELEKKVEHALDVNSLFLPEKLMDLRLYRAQLKRILQSTLYYLKVTTSGNIVYKIGVTQRRIEERILEVHRDLKKHFKVTSIEALGTWSHRGNVEKYFKHRYQDFNYPICSLTEYYKFNGAEDAKVVLQDLCQMEPKVLCQAERDILSSKLSPIEAAMQAQQEAMTHTA